MQEAADKTANMFSSSIVTLSIASALTQIFHSPYKRQPSDESCGIRIICLYQLKQSLFSSIPATFLMELMAVQPWSILTTMLWAGRGIQFTVILTGETKETNAPGPLLSCKLC